MGPGGVKPARLLAWRRLPMPRALVLQHEENEGPGLLASALERAGFQVHARLRRVEPGDEAAPLVVVMGGLQAAYRPSEHPWLLDELRLLRSRVERGLPSLGICLGAQLLAAAAGARVYPGERGVELGRFAVACTSQAAGDEVFSALPARFQALHWHGDTFDLPPGAVWLASSEQYPHQAFRVGRSYGIQFHPELTGAAFLSWVDASPDEVRDRAALEPIRGFPEGEPAIPALLERLANFAARSVGSRA